MSKNNLLLSLISVLTVASFAISFPKVFGGWELDLRPYGIPLTRDLAVKKGLDLQGGMQVVLGADMSGVEETSRVSALESAKTVIERRVNFLGVSEPQIQTSRTGGSYRIIVELPGISDPEQALSAIGQTAQLEFRKFKTDVPPNTIPTLENTEAVGVSGKDLKKADVQFQQQTGEPVVAFKLTAEGGKKFKEVTSSLIGKPLAIFLDGTPVSWPTVQTTIEDEGVITGNFSVEEAKRLVLQLNAGALPVPVEVIQRQDIGPTLGKEAVDRSVLAGISGLLLVGFFMIGNYGRLGILAVLGLTIYGLLTLSVYKMIPVTLTLSGIAGFILSVGMAVDANILIFERIKEERRWGKPLRGAIEIGFGRAWDSIRDANLATLITVFILFNPLDFSFLVTSGAVRGFALTLGLGVLISLFTGVVVTRTLVRVFYR